MNIEPKTLCRYVGVGHPDSKGKVHRIIALEGVAHNKVNVITWSQYKVGDVDSEGWSWYGQQKDFMQQFRPMLEGEK